MSWSSSDDIQHLAAALWEALESIGPIKRDNTAEVKTQTAKYSYNYASLSDVLDVVRPILSSHGLFAFQTAWSTNSLVFVATTIMHRSGQWLRHDPLGLPMGNTPQNTGSAITYARRYTLLASLGLATEDDDAAKAAAAAAAQEANGAQRAPDRDIGDATNRTAAEAETRRLIADLPGAQASDLAAQFREVFGSTLTRLEPGRHADALAWVKNWIDLARATT